MKIKLKKIVEAVTEHLSGGDSELRANRPQYYGAPETSDYWLRSSLGDHLRRVASENISAVDYSKDSIIQKVELSSRSPFHYLVATSVYSNFGWDKDGRGMVTVDVEAEGMPRALFDGNYKVVEGNLQGSRRYVKNFFTKEKADEFAYKRAKRIAEIFAKHSSMPLTDSVAGVTHLHNLE